MERMQEDSISTGYARLKEEMTKRPPPSTKLHRHILIGTLLIILFILCGLLGGIIALRVHLQMTTSNLVQSEGEVFAYENVINNLTTILAADKGGKQAQAYSYKWFTLDSKLSIIITRVSTMNDVLASGTSIRISFPYQVGRTNQPTIVSGPSVVYTRWGAHSCPASAQLLYAGVTASGSTNKNGGGSNHLCMTLDPDFLAPKPGRQGGRSYIYGSEYRSGRDYQPLNNLHGHDAPCAVCLVPQRSVVLMVPGATTCPSKGNWTREYFGYLMSARIDLKRSEYICVDSTAESTPGSNDEFMNGSILFPVEAFCNQNANGGLPCSPYVDGYEVTCAVCTL